MHTLLTITKLCIIDYLAIATQQCITLPAINIIAKLLCVYLASYHYVIECIPRQ